LQDVHFQTGFGTGCFSLTFPWTGGFRIIGFGMGCNFFLPFTSRFLDVDGQKLCEKSAMDWGIAIISRKCLPSKILQIACNVNHFSTTLEGTTQNMIFCDIWNYAML
jgi:hypothetical protein